MKHYAHSAIVIESHYKELNMFGIDLEKAVKESPMFKQLKDEFLAMQRAILDLENRVEELEHINAHKE